MRRFLSTVEDVFELRGRGCVVAPGIPRHFESAVQIGDPLWLSHPDGFEQMTTVGGIEFLTPPNPRGNSLLLGCNLSKANLPIGTRLWIECIPTDIITLTARSQSPPLRLEALFQQDDSGHLGFGGSARPLFPESIADLLREPLEFRDYLVEGFVTYHLHARVADETLTLTASLHGTNRDRYLQGHFAFHLRQAGLILTE